MRHLSAHWDVLLTAGSSFRGYGKSLAIVGTSFDCGSEHHDE
jgi:hypothetical protein